LCMYGQHWFEGIKLRLADSAWYTPDFLVQNQDGKGFSVFEVKGFRYAAGIVRLKVAAELYSGFRFFLCRRIKGEWVIERVGGDT
jgi:hypothetical protein